METQNLRPQKKRRSRPSETDDVDMLGPMLKARKLEADGSNINDVTHEASTVMATQDAPVVVHEPLQTGLQSLFKTFAQFVAVDDLSPRICFIAHFLYLLVQCGRDRIKPVLKLLPPGLVQNLLKVMVTDDRTVGFILRYFILLLLCFFFFMTDFILFLLRIYDLTTASGRQSAMSDLCLLRNIQLRNESINL